MSEALYSLHVTANLPDSQEIEFDCEPELSLGALEDAIATAINNQPTATSFVFVVVYRTNTLS